MSNPTTYLYDVALSFDGAHRPFVTEVAEIVRAAGVTIFFDDFEREDLWGRDLAVHLDKVYRKDARYVVPFISEGYAQRAWPALEFRSALARAVTEREPSILPVRFDDTELPGLPPTVASLDARKLSARQVADAILKKVGRARREAPARAASAASGGPGLGTPSRMPRVVPPDFDPYEEADRAVEVIRRELTARAESLKTQGYAVNARQSARGFQLRVLRHGKLGFSFDLEINDEFGENTIAFNDAGGRGTTGWGHVEWDRERGAAVLKIFSMSLRPQAGSEFRVTAEELAGAFWETLWDRLEQHDRGY